MSKNMTQKSLAYGAGLALVMSGLASVPASADNNGPITLLPEGGAVAGATYSSIIGTGLTLDAVLDPSLRASDDAGSGTDDGNRYAYIITNPAAADIKIDLSNTAESGFLVYTESGQTSQNGTDANQTFTTGDLNSPGDALYVDVEAGNIYTTNTTKILIEADDQDVTASQDAISSVLIDSLETVTTTVTVQAIADTDSSGATTTGIVGPFENASAVETVTLLPVGNVTATTVITSIDRSTGATEGEVTFTVDYGNSINRFAVDSLTKVTLFKDGDAQSLDENTTPAGANIEKLSAETYTAADSGKIKVTGFNDDGTTEVAFGAGSYSAQAYYFDGANNIAIGSPSPVVNLTNGLVTGVDEADAFATEGANLKYTEGSPDAGLVRTGTNAVTVQVEAEDSSNERIKSSGIEYRVVATANKLASTSTISMSGTTSTLTAKDDTATATAVSGSTGLVDIVVSNSGAVKGDKVTLDIDAKKTDGTYSTADQVTLEWVDADLDTFKASPAYVSGANPTVTFKAADQFGQPVNATDVGQLSVTVVAEVGGVEDTSLVSETKTLVNGEASFTFANFATGAGQARLQADLFEGRTAVADADLSSGNNTIFVTVYDTDGVDSISVLDSYATDVIYADYVVGDEDDAAVAKAIADTNFTAEASDVISGSVLDANSVGQPGAEVVISGEGLLFYDSQLGIYAEDSITIYANEFGAYDVTVRSHEQNAAGIPVTITSGSVTADTLVKTYFPSSGLGADTLVFSWDLPAELVMNTTYAVTASLKDIWGNPVDTANGTNSVTFDGNGAVQVNGIANATNKDFNADGEVTVFVRSIKDIAGPAEVTATLNSAGEYFVEPTSTGVVVRSAFASLTTRSSDVDTTSWDETLFDSTLEAEFDVKETATPSSNQKVNAGSFKGYVAVYALGYEGQRLSAKIGNDWVIVDPIVNNESANLARVTDFTGAGYDIAVRIYIDRVLIDTINLTTK